MIGFANLEVQFASYKREIEQYHAVKDYANMMVAIRNAMPCCQRLYEEATDARKKELMAQNAAQLKKLYAQCKERLEAAGKEIPAAAGGNAPKAAKTASQSQSANAVRSGQSTETKKEAKGGAQANVEYNINGVDVKQFLTLDSNETVTFEDVKGMHEEKELIEREFFLSEEERAFNERIGKKNKTFILLYGVPGTGKTFFAKAISCELKAREQDGENVPFFSVVGTQLKDSKVGASEKNIQAVFEFCKQFKHCVLFIDEFDSIAPDRAKDTGDPTAQTCVTTLLQMMDGFSSSKGTLVIAATNCPYNLDGAILSRANVRIEIPLPTDEVILGTLRAKIGDLIDEEVDLEQVTKRLNGYSNRDITNVVEALREELSVCFSKGRKEGDTRSFEEYRYTNEMIDRALKRIVPTTKASDLRRIEEFKRSGE